MEGTTDEQRNENERLQPQQNSQTEYVASTGLAGFPTSSIPNGNEVHHTQVLENERTHVVENQNGDQGLKAQENAVATSLGLAQVPQNVSVVSVSVGQDGQIVESTINSGATNVERPDDSAQTSNLVAVPADYHGLTTGHLQPTYVLPAQTEGDDSMHGSVDGDDKDREDILREQKHGGAIQIEDRFLPIANVARIMKKSIPRSGKIAKDAKECVQECVSEFISFITSEASDRCHQEKRKTINGEDILFAMSTLGFDNYVEPLKLYLQKYRDSIKGDKSSMNSSTSENQDESMESHMHPTMITADQATPPTIYTPYQTQMQQPLHFP